MSFEQILINRDGGVVTIAINHPPLNVLSAQVGRELGEALDRIESDSAVSVVILTGSGDRAFAAGADIRELQRLSGSDAEEMTHRWHRLFPADRRIPAAGHRRRERGGAWRRVRTGHGVRHALRLR